jgi:phage tail sheath protein FI
MPVQPTYPGVYVQEVPSGVRTIVGVSTSVTAFVGKAKSGPINRPVTIYNYSEYEKRFGGLSADSEMSYAVRSFFLNGGSQAIIVRIALNPTTATREMRNSANVLVFRAHALDQGSTGNDIDLNVDWDTATPDSTFNLTVRMRKYDPPSTNKTTNFTITHTETFIGLSPNPSHPRYFLTAVNDVSELVEIETLNVAIAGNGTAAGPFIAAANQPAYIAQVDAAHNTFRISVNGGDPQNVSIPVAAYANMTALAAAIHLITNPAPINCACAVDPVVLGPQNRLVLTSNVGGPNSRVEIMPGLTNDVSARLGLGPANGGTQVDAAQVNRPVVDPGHATLRGITPVPALGANFTGSFDISLDGHTVQTVDITALALGALAPVAQTRAAVLAAEIQRQVRLMRPGLTAYDDFTCTNLDLAGAASDALTLRSGTRGGGSSVSVSGGALATFGLAATTFAAGADSFLSGGGESDFTEAQAYGVFIGSRAARQGLYALEAVDIFNMLCLPGIPDSGTLRAGILSDAGVYCQERRAFLIVDASNSDDLPSEINSTIIGTNLPKIDNAAVYYPWIRIPDPLNGGLPRVSAPCGAVAGVFARTDANRGVWKAPAGTEAVLNGVTSLTYTLTDPENGSLNPLGVNCLRTFPVYGNIVWGARTLRGNDQMASEYKYVPVRRLAYYIEESLYRGLKWAVFEPNDEPLWAQIRLNVGAFMSNLFRQGAFQGQKRDEAYFVKCDKETTTQNDINLGIVNIWVGFAPLKPAEFVILYIQQIAGQVQV